MRSEMEVQQSDCQETVPQHTAPQQPLSQEQDQIQQVEVLDPDEVPPKYRPDRSRSGRGRNCSSRGKGDTSSRNMSRDQSTLPSREAARRADGHGVRHSAPASEPPGMIKKFASFTSGIFLPSPKKSSAKDNSEQERQKNQNNTGRAAEEVHRGNGTNEQTPMPENHVMALNQRFQQTIEAKEQEWETREKQLQHQISQASHHLQHLQENTRILQSKLLDSESQKSSIQEEHNAFIRKHQEASFRQMESARWLPTDESKVMDDLDRLKRDMRSWAKVTSVKDISFFRSLEDADNAALIGALANVVLFENGQFPKGLLMTAKSPMLLLNALVAHNLYTSFFRRPFFFLSNGHGEHSSNVRSEGILEDIYERAKTANQQEAHIWRSQTLRLLMPPLRNDSSESENQLRYTTEELIAKVAARQSSEFLNSPACYLIDQKSKVDFKKKLSKLFNDAARLSYMLWTRRTEMRCFTLHELKHLAFDSESPDFDPDSLVKWEDHDDLLKDKPVTVIVHPLLKVYGNDEAKDYDQGRVWAKGIVWLDSKA